MNHREFQDWMDALRRRRPDGSPAAGWGPRRNAARRLAAYAFRDPEALDLVISAALHDTDHRVRETARMALGREALRKLHAGGAEARLSVMCRAADLLPMARAAAEARRTG